MFSFSTKRAFTLIELLVVVAIISLLSSIVMTSLNDVRSKARDSERLSEVRQFQKALELYYDKNSVYPNSGWVSSCQAAWSTGIGSALAEFLPTMPTDPINDCTGYAYGGYKNYSYFSTSYYPAGGKPGQWYMIVFNLENQNLSLDATNSSTDCVGNFRNYGGQDGYRITMGGNCIK